MTAKEYLNKVREAERVLNTLEHERKQIQDDIYTLSATNYDKVIVSGSKIVDTSDKIVRLEEILLRVNSAWNNLISLREEARVLIEKIGSEKQKTLLKQRYLLYWEWVDIAANWDNGPNKSKGCSWQNLHDMHARALKNFEVLLQ